MLLLWLWLWLRLSSWLLLLLLLVVVVVVVSCATRLVVELCWVAEQSVKFTHCTQL